MVKINDDGRVHQSFVENYPGTPFPEVRFWPYWDGSKALATLKHAIKIIEKGVYRKNHMCQQYFRTLPNGNSFDDLWGRNTVWFNYDPRSGTNFLAFTSTSRTTEITISDDAFDRGVWVVAASIIHEFAHLNGAPGQDGSGSRAAEESLKHCGFAAHFNPDAIGIMRVYSELRGTRLA